MEEQKSVSFLDIWRTANPPKKYFRVERHLLLHIVYQR